MAAVIANTALVPPEAEDDTYAITLQLEEIHSFTSTRKEKYPQDKVPESETAVQDFQIELERLLLASNDHRFAQNIDKAVADDAAALRDFAFIENQALRDREITRKLNNRQPLRSTEDISESIGKLQLSSPTYERLPHAALASHSEGGEVAGPSQSWQERQQQSLLRSPTLPTAECVACRDVFHSKELLKSPCNDCYCANCLKSLFIRATGDETLFPPRCCGQAIPLSLVEERLATEALLAFKVATIEFTTTNRTYCASKGCRRFIPPGNIHSSRATCSGCNSETCAYCKELFHTGDCPKDEALQELLVLAVGKKWRRCFRCKTMVELNWGCNHIICKCSAQFCYVCGMEWKRCTCDIWDERYLLNRAEEVVDRELDRPVAARELQQRAARMRQALLAQHECDYYGRWEKEEGDVIRSYTCEMCNMRLRKFIFRCPECHLRACADCKRNRT